MEGTLLGQGLKFGIVVGRFNEFITNRLFGRSPGCSEPAWSCRTGTSK